MNIPFGPAHWLTLTTRVAMRRLSQLNVRGVPRLLHATAPWLLGPGLAVREGISGLRLPIDTDDYASCMMHYGRFDPALIAVLLQLCRPGASVLDIGAQLGYVTALLARAVGSSGVVSAFEPDPNAIRRLSITVRENRLAWVSIFPVAASDASGKLSFNVAPTLGWSTAVSNTHLKDLQLIQVDAVRVDDLAGDGKIRRPVSLVKIDVEGYECSVLDGMRRLLAEDRPFLITEIHPLLLSATSRTAKDVLGQLAVDGYELYVIAQQKYSLRAGNVLLKRVTPESVVANCDVLGVPRERQLPNSLRRAIAFA